MNFHLSGKTVLVTGASQGIGLAIARAFHQEGCEVMLNGRDAAKLQACAEDLGQMTSYFSADVTDPESCKKLITATKERYGKLDVLICNVGSGASVAPGSESFEEWMKVLRVNLLAATNMVEAAIPLLEKSEAPSIVCISSICGLESLGAPVTYSAAKAALNAFVVGVSRPLAKKNIRINALAPGNILFKGSTWERRQAQDPVGVQEMLKREVALQRLGRPEEVADFAVFLASSRAAFVTGSVQVIDGGQVRS